MKQSTIQRTAVFILILAGLLAALGGRIHSEPRHSAPPDHSQVQAEVRLQPVGRLCFGLPFL